LADAGYDSKRNKVAEAMGAEPAASNPRNGRRKLRDIAFLRLSVASWSISTDLFEELSVEKMLNKASGHGQESFNGLGGLDKPRREGH
jgi:hypothetical protein